MNNVADVYRSQIFLVDNNSENSCENTFTMFSLCERKFYPVLQFLKGFIFIVGSYNLVADMFAFHVSKDNKNSIGKTISFCNASIFWNHISYELLLNLWNP